MTPEILGQLASVQLERVIGFNTLAYVLHSVRLTAIT